MAANEGPSAHSTARDEPEAEPTSRVGGSAAPAEEPDMALAWRLLTSPRTMLALSGLLALLLVIAAALPQRPSAGELARRLPFASADVASGLGLNDVLVAWPTLLLVLLLGLNAAGLLIAHRTNRRRHDARMVAQASTVVAAPIERIRSGIAEGRVRTLARMPLRMTHAAAQGRRGLSHEGAGLALIGVVALLIGLAVARASALDARLQLAPATGALSEATVRDGDLLLPRSLPYAVTCERPDPQDPRRAFDCRLAARGQTEPTQVSLAPGYTSDVGDLELRPLREDVRRFGSGEPFDLVLTHGGSSGPRAVERLRLEPGKTIALRTTGQRLTAFAGPDGPLIVVEADRLAPVLLAPSSRADRAAQGEAVTAAGDLRIEVETPTLLVVAATSAPEAPLVLAGVMLLALGLLLMGLVPHLELRLDQSGEGTRITLWSSNRVALPEAALRELVAAARVGT